LLSSIIRLLNKLMIHKTTRVELTHEIKMTLSFMESGCLATSLNDMTVFVFKGSHNEIESINNTSQIFFGLECIKRPEFPSVRMYFDLRDKSKKPFLFDYFFNIESDEDMKLLGKLAEQEKENLFCHITRCKCSYISNRSHWVCWTHNSSRA